MRRFELGDRGARVVSLQRALIALGHPLADDGDFGPKTLAAAQAYVQERTHDGVPPWLAEAIVADAAARRETMSIRTVGAWCGRASLARPERDMEFAVRHNINRLDIVVNDHATWRAPHPFTVRSRASIERLARLARRRGIEVHLMSWIMPHAKYIDGAAEALIPLCENVGAVSLQWDAEEPWTLAEQSMGYRRAAQHLKDAFEPLPIPMGVNGIGFAPVRKLGPLAEVCDYVVPQAYATSTSGQDPATAPKRFFRRWTDRFARPVVLGLAAYRQSGIEGYSISTAMDAAIASAQSTGVETVVYWSLRHIRGSKQVAASIRSILGGAQA